MAIDDGYSLELEYEGAGAEVLINRDYEGELEMEISGITGRTFVPVDVAALEDFRNFLSDVIQQERAKAGES